MIPTGTKTVIARAMRAYPYEHTRTGRTYRRTYLLTPDNRASIRARLADAFSDAVPLIRDEPVDGVRAITVRVRGRVERIYYIEA